MSPTASLLELPDDIILLVLGDLSAWDVVNCSFVSRRLQRICLDHTLWTRADFITGGRELSTSQAELALTFLCARTKSLQIRAISQPEQLFSKRLLRKVIRTCPDLRTLVLENWSLDLSVQDFPRKLWRLSISGSKPAEVPEILPKQCKRKQHSWDTPIFEQRKKQQQKRSYFFGIFLAIPRLQSLDLSCCQWLDNHSLLALSKCQHLRELSINGCAKMGGCVAYSALAAGMGFSALERLDVRNTNMEDIDLKNFLSKSTIEQLFVGCNFGPPEPRISFTDEELEVWDSKQQWPEEETNYLASARDSRLGNSSDEGETSSTWPTLYSDSTDSEESEPPRKMSRCDKNETSSEIGTSGFKKSPCKNYVPKSYEIASNLIHSAASELHSYVNDGKDSNAPACSASTSSPYDLCSNESCGSGLTSSSNANGSESPSNDLKYMKNKGIQPEKTRQIVAVLETIRRVDDQRPEEGGITLQIRASRHDIADVQPSRNTEKIEKPENAVQEGLPRGVVLQLVRPREALQEQEAEIAEVTPRAGSSKDLNQSDAELQKFPVQDEPRQETQQLTMTLKGKVWSPWQQFNEDSVEPSRLQRERDSTTEGEDFEEYLEEDGRNVIVLNCMNEGIHRTTHVYTKLDFPTVSKKNKPGLYVTDDLVRYPVQCKKLQVLSLAGCKKVTDTFLTFLVRHDLNCLRLLDVRGTAVTEKAVLNLQAYMGNNLTVHFSS